MMLYSRPEAALTAVLLAAGLLPMNANAYVSFSKNGEELINTLHTHIYSPTLSLPSSKEIKVAKVCFITDVSDCSGNEFANSDDMENNGSPDDGGNPDYDLDNAERCRNEGYTISGCPDGFKPSGKCPYGDYYAKCVEACPSGYKTCEPPYYGVGEACDGKYASCEEDTERACKEINPNYTNTCESGWQINPNDKCKYDETFGTCCNQCIGYDYTSIPEGYIQDGEACTDCNGQTKYKVKPNPCDGYLDCGSMGGEAGAETCLSGTITKYDNCKPCPNLGTLTSCPANYVCEYEECSNRYYKTGCQSGYDWDPIAQTCTEQCDATYKYTCTGTYESPSGTACAGKYTACTCRSPYTWKKGACSCDSSYKYTCSRVLGASGGSGTSCNGKYQSCTCKCSSWSSGSCVAFDTPCTKGKELGYILYSDMSRSSPYSSSLTSGKTPIGVVVCSYAGGGGQAVSLKNLPEVKWGDDDSVPLSLPYINSRTKAIQDISSCANTQKILAAGNSSVYSAAWAAHNYSTAGTKAGDWCLPAAGVFYASLFTDAVNRGLDLAKGDRFPREVWFSSADAPYYAWLYSFTAECGMRDYGPLRPAYVRPVIEF